MTVASSTPQLPSPTIIHSRFRHTSTRPLPSVLLSTSLTSPLHCTVEPPIKETPNKGHTKRTSQQGHTLRFQIIHFRRKDNPPLYDKMPGPKVSIIQRFHDLLLPKCGFLSLARSTNIPGTLTLDLEGM